MLERIRASLPELADKKRERYVSELGITPKIAAILTANRKIALLFDETAVLSSAPVETANLIVGSTLPEDYTPAPELAAKLAECIKLVLAKKINRNSYKEVVSLLFADSKTDPLAYIEEKGLIMVEDTGAAETAVREILAENADAVADYRAGKQKAFGFLMGQAMKKLGKSASPDVIKATLTTILEE
jgi:aspartyl-tRNA(Asn)/glutamyl-tRNA(Gln) amidotransferase subunit B